MIAKGNTLKQIKPRPAGALFPLLLLALAGCAGSREYAAFDLFDDERGKFFAPRPSGKKDLPDLKESGALSNLLAFAALNNPGLEAAFYEWKSELEKIPQARSFPDPRLTYSYFIREVETRVGPQRQAFTLSQTFPWLGKLQARHDAALQSAEAARMRYQAGKLRLFHNVKHAYFEYAYQARAIEVTRENTRLLKYLESVVRTKFKTGAASHPAVIKLQVELGKLEDRLKSLEDYRKPLLARLNETLGRPVDAPLGPSEPPPDQPVDLDESELYARMGKRNPELAALDARIEMEHARVRLAKSSWYPDLTLGVGYVDTDEALLDGTPDSGKDPILATFSINLPLWGGTYNSAERDAAAKERAARKSRESMENRLGSALSIALYHFRDAERKIDLYRDTLIPKAKQSLAAVQQSFIAGNGDYLDLIDAERALLDFQLSYERARANRAQRLSEIEMLTGQPLPLSGSQDGRNK